MDKVHKPEAMARNCSTMRYSSHSTWSGLVPAAWYCAVLPANIRVSGVTPGSPLMAWVTTVVVLQASDRKWTEKRNQDLKATLLLLQIQNSLKKKKKTLVRTCRGSCLGCGCACVASEPTSSGRFCPTLSQRWCPCRLRPHLWHRWSQQQGSVAQTLREEDRM